ncbi:MAG: hypothetical protein ACYS0E_05605 [Planctomycetota bacterium]
MTAEAIPFVRSPGGIVPMAVIVIFAAVQMATALRGTSEETSRVLADRVRTAIDRGMRWPLWN